MNEGQKLNAKQIRQLPQAVTDKVKAYQERYRTRFCQLYLESPGYALYLGEGCSYTAYDASGRELDTVTMLSARTMHNPRDKRKTRIGDRIPIPQGAWVVEFELFCGKPIINVYHAGAWQLEA